MPRIAPLPRGTAAATTAATLDAVKAKLGMVPNLFSTFARAPAVLDAYLGLGDALSKGKLTARQREIITLAVSQANSCQYCLSAHTTLAKRAGLTESEVRDARAGVARDRLEAAIAALALQIVQERGNVSDNDFEAAKASGIDESMMVEILGNVSVNILTNYTNNFARTEIDFPVVSL
jgi:uncharacterized peroxidase-related enzyme